MPNFFKIIYKNSVRTSQETYYISARKFILLMLFREIIALHCHQHTKHRNTLCGQNAKFWYVKAGGAYGNRWDLKG
jgi:hypothetical protein